MESNIQQKEKRSFYSSMVFYCITALDWVRWANNCTISTKKTEGYFSWYRFSHIKYHNNTNIVNIQTLQNMSLSIVGESLRLCVELTNILSIKLNQIRKAIFNHSVWYRTMPITFYKIACKYYNTDFMLSTVANIDGCIFLVKPNLINDKQNVPIENI